MGSLSDYSEKAVLDHILKVNPFSQPTNLYIGLSKTDPLDNGSGILEPSGGGYERILCNSWTVGSRLAYNTSAVTFPVATDDQGTLTHFFVADADVAGNMISHGLLSEPKTILNGKQLSLSAGKLRIFFKTGGISNYLADLMLAHIFKGAPYTAPTDIYIALATDEIQDSDTGSTITEPSAASYDRVVANAWNAASLGAGQSNNDGDINFAVAVQAFGTLVDFALIDASSAGNMMVYGSLDSAQIGVIGSEFQFLDETLVIALS